MARLATDTEMRLADCEGDLVTAQHFGGWIGLPMLPPIAPVLPLRAHAGNSEESAMALPVCTAPRKRFRRFKGDAVICIGAVVKFRARLAQAANRSICQNYEFYNKSCAARDSYPSRCDLPHPT